MKNNVNLATTTNITSTYVGEFASEYFAAALLSAASLDSGGITIMPNIKYQSAITQMSNSGLITNATCDFDASSTVTLTEKLVTPKELQVNVQMCKKDFIQQFDAAQMGFSAHSSVPKSFSDFLVGQILGNVAQSCETQIWSGNSSTAGELNGIITELTLDAALPAAQEGATTALSTANIIATFTAITDDITSAMYSQPNLAFYASTNAVKFYIAALGGHYVLGATPFSSAGGAGTDGKGTQWAGRTQGLTYGGIPIIHCPGMPDDHIICTYKENLIFGTGLLNDTNEIKLIDMADIDGSQNFRFVARFTGVATYQTAVDVCTYGFANGAN
jgi:hypothetical protein